MGVLHRVRRQLGGDDLRIDEAVVGSPRDQHLPDESPHLAQRGGRADENAGEGVVSCAGSRAQYGRLVRQRKDVGMVVAHLLRRGEIAGRLQRRQGVAAEEREVVMFGEAVPQ